MAPNCGYTRPQGCPPAHLGGSRRAGPRDDFAAVVAGSGHLGLTTSTSCTATPTRPRSARHLRFRSTRSPAAARCRRPQGPRRAKSSRRPMLEVRSTTEWENGRWFVKCDPKGQHHPGNRHGLALLAGAARGGGGGGAGFEGPSTHDGLQPPNLTFPFRANLRLRRGTGTGSNVRRSSRRRPARTDHPMIVEGQVYYGGPRHGIGGWR